MAGKDGAGKNVRKKSKPLNYFYLNGLLHKKLHINRGADTITAWCYPEHRRVAYTYSDVMRNKETAFTMTQVAQMVNRRKLTIERAILRGDIAEPQYTYGLNEAKKKFQYMWRESDIMDLHAYLSTVHVGRPRHDGLVTPKRLPTARELRAAIRHNQVMYVKTEDGEFIPSWQAENF